MLSADTVLGRHLGLYRIVNKALDSFFSVVYAYLPQRLLLSCIYKQRHLRGYHYVIIASRHVIYVYLLLRRSVT